MAEQCSAPVAAFASVAGSLAGAGTGYYRDLGRKAGRAIILGVEAPKSTGCYTPITNAFVAPFEEGLRESLEPFIGKKVVFGAAGLLVLGGALGWWIRGRRS